MKKGDYETKIGSRFDDSIKQKKEDEEKRKVVNLVSHNHAAQDTSDSNAVLDTASDYSAIDLLQHIPDGHFFKELSIQVGLMCKLPPNTVFMVGIATFASLACRKWCVNYQYGGRLPLGIYAAIEQPSAAAKSWCLEIFQKPFFEHQKTTVQKLKLERDRAKRAAQEKEGKEPEQIKSEKDALMIANEAFDLASKGLFVTNSTPEGLEKELIKTNGFFAAVSSEQGLFNTLIGDMYGNESRKKNNDIVLSGSNGGYVSGHRSGRDSYTGRVIGGVMCFAQTGSIETVLRESQGTGLAERFIFIKEGHYLGARDHLKFYPVDESLLAMYHNLCVFIGSALESPIDCENLLCLNLSAKGYHLIKTYRNRIEPELGDKGRFSNSNLRGFAGKIDGVIMKLAACLHLSSGDYDLQAVIPDTLVIAAIGMAGEFLESCHDISTSHGVIGDSAEFKSILSLFEKDNRPRTERQIIQTKTAALPFRDYQGNKSDAIRACLSLMVVQKLLKIVYYPESPKLKLYTLAQ